MNLGGQFPRHDNKTFFRGRFLLELFYAPEHKIKTWIFPNNLSGLSSLQQLFLKSSNQNQKLPSALSLHLDQTCQNLYVTTRSPDSHHALAVWVQFGAFGGGDGGRGVQLSVQCSKLLHLFQHLLRLAPGHPCLPQESLCFSWFLPLHLSPLPSPPSSLPLHLPQQPLRLLQLLVDQILQLVNGHRGAGWRRCSWKRGHLVLSCFSLWVWKYFVHWGAAFFFCWRQTFSRLGALDGGCLLPHHHPLTRKAVGFPRNVFSPGRESAISFGPRTLQTEVGLSLLHTDVFEAVGFLRHCVLLLDQIQSQHPIWGGGGGLNRREEEVSQFSGFMKLRQMFSAVWSNI